MSQRGKHKVTDDQLASIETITTLAEAIRQFSERLTHLEENSKNLQARPRPGVGYPQQLAPGEDINESRLVKIEEEMKKFRKTTHKFRRSVRLLQSEASLDGTDSTTEMSCFFPPSAILTKINGKLAEFSKNLNERFAQLEESNQKLSDAMDQLKQKTDVLQGIIATQESINTINKRLSQVEKNQKEIIGADLSAINDKLKIVDERFVTFNDLNKTVIGSENTRVGKLEFADFSKRLEETIDNLKNENAILNTKMSHILEIPLETLASIDYVEERLQTTPDAGFAADGAQKMTQEQVDVLQKQVISLEQNISQLNEAKTYISSRVDSLETQLEKTETSILTFREHETTIKEQLNQADLLKVNMEQLKQSIDDIEDTMITQTNLQTILNEKLQGTDEFITKDRFDEFISTVPTKTDNIHYFQLLEEQTDTKINSLQKTLDEMRTDSVPLEEDTTSDTEQLRRQLDEICITFNQELQEIRSLLQTKAALQQTETLVANLDSLQRDVATKSQQTDLSRRVDFIEKNLSTRLVGLERKLMSLEPGDVRQFNSPIVPDQTESINALATELANEKQERTTFEQQILEDLSSIRSQYLSQRAFETKTGFFEETTTEIKNQMADVKHTVSKLKSKVMNLPYVSEDKVDEKITSSAHLVQRKLAVNFITKEEMDELHFQMKENTGTLNAVVESVRQNLEQESSQLQELQTKIPLIDDLQHKVEALQRETQISAELAEQSKNNPAASKEISELQIRLRHVIDEHDQFVRKITEKTGTLESSLDNDVAFIKRQIKEMQEIFGGQIQQALGQIDALERDARVREDQIGDTPRMIADCTEKNKSAIKDLRNKLREQIAGLNSKIDQALLLDEEIEELRGSVTRVSDTVKGLSGDETSSRLSSIETELLRIMGLCNNNAEQLTAVSKVTKKHYRKLSRKIDQISTEVSDIHQSECEDDDILSPDMQMLSIQVTKLEERIDEFDMQSRNMKGSIARIETKTDEFTNYLPKEFVDIEEFRIMQEEVSEFHNVSKQLMEQVAIDRENSRSKINKIQKKIERLKNNIAATPETETGESEAAQASALQDRTLEELENLKLFVADNNLAFKKQLRKLKHQIHAVERTEVQSDGGNQETNQQGAVAVVKASHSQPPECPDTLLRYTIERESKADGVIEVLPVTYTTSLTANDLRLFYVMMAGLILYFVITELLV